MRRFRLKIHRFQVSNLFLGKGLEKKSIFYRTFLPKANTQ
jgi:hypothetical protein